MKILIADDHVMVRRGLRMLLEKLFEGVSVEGAGSVQELMEMLAQNDPPDIILLDLIMPGMNGLEGLEAVCREVPDVPVAIISAWEEVDDVVAAIQRGAKGFILKSSDEKVLKLAISLILSGETYIPSHVFKGEERMDIEKFRTAGSLFLSGNPLNQLTKRENGVLRHLMLGQTNKEIALNLGLLEGSVKKYTHMIFKKLQVSNRTKAVIRATELGWLQIDGDDPNTAPQAADGE